MSSVEKISGQTFNPVRTVQYIASEIPPACVNREWRAANRALQNQVADDLGFQSRETQERIQTEYRRVFAEGADPQATSERLVAEIGLLQIQTLVLRRNSITGEYGSNRNRISARQNEPYRFCLYLHGIKTRLEGMRDLLAQAPAPDDLENQFQGLDRDLISYQRRFLIRERLAEKVAAARAAGNHPLAHIHQTQRIACSIDPQFQAEFRAHVVRRGSSFLPERFVQGEGIALTAERLYDEALMEVWTNAGDSSHGGVLPYLPDAHQIRNWMNNPNNAALLGQIRDFSDFKRSEDLHMSVIPPEIRRFTGLETLSFVGERGENITHLPEEFAELQNLRYLRIQNSAFREFPSVVHRLPNLQSFDMCGNQNTYTLLRDEDWRLVGTGWQNEARRYFVNSANGLLKILGQEEWGQSFYEENLDRLTDAPFGLWFTETFRAPSIPLLTAPFVLPFIAVMTIQAWMQNIAGSIFVIPIILALVASAAVVLTGSLITIAINLPFVAYNLLLLKVVEPIVTAIRDWQGHSRMVHLRD